MDGLYFGTALPYPPSINHYWRHPTRGALAGRHLISEEGRDYRERVKAHLFGRLVNKCGGGLEWIKESKRLAVQIVVYPPDRRKRDLDNLLKPLLDALTHAGLWRDDYPVRDIHVADGEVVKGGGCLVRITTAAEPHSSALLLAHEQGTQGLG